LPQHLYAETLLSPGLGVVFQWRFQNCGHHLLDILDPASPVHGALRQAIERFENTVFELAPDKPTLIEWANSQKTLQDTADRRELRLGGAHVFQQSIELFQGMQMMTDRAEDPHRLAAIHHDIGDVMGFIGQRSGSAHFLEQAAMSYEQALELRTQDGMPREWAQTTSNLGLVMLTLGSLQDDASMLKQALQTFKEAVNFLPREEMPEDWAAALSPRSATWPRCCACSERIGGVPAPSSSPWWPIATRWENALRRRIFPRGSSRRTTLPRRCRPWANTKRTSPLWKRPSRSTTRF
jgi:hypothetical protein